MNIWEDTFSKREWGSYPPEALVRIATRYRKTLNLNPTRCLDLGCGPGANSSLLISLFNQYCAIDGSKTAIAKLLLKHNDLSSIDARVGNFTSLPWPDTYFNFVCDNMAIYANTESDILSTLSEISRVLCSESLFYSRVWGLNTFGYSRSDSYTFDMLSKGVCANYGTTTFFDLDYINSIYGRFFNILEIQQISTSTFDSSLKENPEQAIQEYIIISTKR